LGLSTLAKPDNDLIDLDVALSTWTQEWAQRYVRANP
jgi:hypothetical protein